MENLPPHTIQDRIYKVADGIEIPLRIFLPVATGGTPVDHIPTLVFVHGGSFTMGQHYIPPTTFSHLFLAGGWAIVSIAHRFLPHVTIYDQIADLSDALLFLQNNMAPLLDLDRWVLAGHSSGSSITGSALCLKVFDPPPCAWISSAGASDYTVQMYNPLYSDTDAPSHDPIRYPRNQVNAPIATASGPGRSDAELRRLWQAPDHKFTGLEDKQLEHAAEFCNVGLEGVVPPDGKGVTLVRELFRADLFESEDAYRAECRRLSPFHAVRADTFTRIHVYFIQGEEDVWVMPDWSRVFLEELLQHGYEAKASFLLALRHDDGMALDPNSPLWDQHIQPILAFCNRARESC